jgi:hypothetical protein
MRSRLYSLFFLFILLSSGSADAAFTTFVTENISIGSGGENVTVVSLYNDSNAKIGRLNVQITPSVAGTFNVSLGNDSNTQSLSAGETGTFALTPYEPGVNLSIATDSTAYDYVATAQYIQVSSTTPKGYSQYLGVLFPDDTTGNDPGVWSWFGGALQVWYSLIGPNVFWIGIIVVFSMAVLIVTKQLTVIASIFMTAGPIIAMILPEELGGVAKFLWTLAVMSVFVMISKRK